MSAAPTFLRLAFHSHGRSETIRLVEHPCGPALLYRHVSTDRVEEILCFPTRAEWDALRWHVEDAREGLPGGHRISVDAGADSSVIAWDGEEPRTWPPRTKGLSEITGYREIQGVLAVGELAPSENAITDRPVDDDTLVRVAALAGPRLAEHVTRGHDRDVLTFAVSAALGYLTARHEVTARPARTGPDPAVVSWDTDLVSGDPAGIQIEVASLDGHLRAIFELLEILGSGGLRRGYLVTWAPSDVFRVGPFAELYTPGAMWDLRELLARRPDLWPTVQRELGPGSARSAFSARWLDRVAVGQGSELNVLRIDLARGSTDRIESATTAWSACGAPIRPR